MFNVLRVNLVVNFYQIFFIIGGLWVINCGHEKLVTEIHRWYIEGGGFHMQNSNCIFICLFLYAHAFILTSSSSTFSEAAIAVHFAPIFEHIF